MIPLIETITRYYKSMMNETASTAPPPSTDEGERLRILSQFPVTISRLFTGIAVRLASEEREKCRMHLLAYEDQAARVIRWQYRKDKLSDWDAFIPIASTMRSDMVTLAPQQKELGIDDSAEFTSLCNAMDVMLTYASLGSARHHFTKKFLEILSSSLQLDNNNPFRFSAKANATAVNEVSELLEPGKLKTTQAISRLFTSPPDSTIVAEVSGLSPESIKEAVKAISDHLDDTYRAEAVGAISKLSDADKTVAITAISELSQGSKTKIAEIISLLLDQYREKAAEAIHLVLCMASEVSGRPTGELTAAISELKKEDDAVLQFKLQEAQKKFFDKAWEERYGISRPSNGVTDVLKPILF